MPAPTPKREAVNDWRLARVCKWKSAKYCYVSKLRKTAYLAVVHNRLLHHRVDLKLLFRRHRDGLAVHSSIWTESRDTFRKSGESELGLTEMGKPAVDPALSTDCRYPESLKLASVPVGHFETRNASFGE